jgi:hypothetical protein
LFWGLDSDLVLLVPFWNVLFLAGESVVPPPLAL